MNSENSQTNILADYDINSRKNSRTHKNAINKVYPSKITSVADSNLEQNIEGKKEAEEHRESWGGKLSFFFSALSYSVGLGAVWRFPYLCYKNGGGAFLIPFLIFLVLVGIPIMFLELSVGQFTSRGPILSWVMVPLFKGVGISMNIINNYVNIYYILIIGYSLYYLVLSFRAELLWEKCGESWKSPNCVDNFDPKNFTFNKCENETLYLKCDYNGQCYSKFTTQGLPATCPTADSINPYLINLGYHNPIFPAQDYWNNVILKKSPDMDHTGTLVWQLVVALFLAWLICFLTLFRGVKMSGIIVYFTAIFPYLVLFILGINGWLLDGADIGIEFYIKPDPVKLADPAVWKTAAVQVFFTLSLSYGGNIALSSYNKYNHNILRDTLILSCANFLTCILAGFVVFAYMGALAKSTGLDIENVVQSGQGLVYIVYPYAATTLPAPPVWSIMFFLMMIALGMGTMMASVETLTTSLEDFFPYFKKTPRIKAITLGTICTLYFLSGLLLCSQTGTYWVDLFDEYSANWSILIIALVECISVSWFYGVGRFKRDISTMLNTYQTLNHVLFYWWWFCWTILTPLLLAVLCVWSWIESGPIESSGYEFPYWSNVVGQMLSASSLLGIFGWMAYAVIDALYINKQPLINLIKPSKEWRPLLNENYQLVLDAHITGIFEKPIPMHNIANH